MTCMPLSIEQVARHVTLCGSVESPPAPRTPNTRAVDARAAGRRAAGVLFPRACASIEEGLLEGVRRCRSCRSTLYNARHQTGLLQSHQPDGSLLRGAREVDRAVVA